jgi:hypothetical protein
MKPEAPDYTDFAYSGYKTWYLQWNDGDPREHIARLPGRMQRNKCPLRLSVLSVEEQAALFQAQEELKNK